MGRSGWIAAPHVFYKNVAHADIRGLVSAWQDSNLWPTD